jgi:serine/threonine protein kinase
VPLGNAPSQMQRKIQQPARHVQCSVAAFETGLQETGTRPFAEPQHKYLLGELLGSGTAARVVVGTDTATQAQYAVKMLPKQRGAKNRTEQIKQEVSSWDCQRRELSRPAVSNTDLVKAAVIFAMLQWQLLAPLLWRCLMRLPTAVGCSIAGHSHGLLRCKYTLNEASSRVSAVLICVVADCHQREPAVLQTCCEDCRLL